MSDRDRSLPVTGRHTAPCSVCNSGKRLVGGDRPCSCANCGRRWAPDAHEAHDEPVSREQRAIDAQHAAYDAQVARDLQEHLAVRNADIADMCQCGESTIGTCTSCDAHRMGWEDGVEAERARLVSWLRGYCDHEGDGPWCGACGEGRICDGQRFADAIERGTDREGEQHE